MIPRRQMLLTGLGVLDLMLVLCSLAAALAVNVGMPLTGLLERSLSLGEVLLLALYFVYWHVALATAGLYGSYRLSSASREMRDVAFAAGLACAPVPMLGTLLGYQRIGLAFAVTLWALSVMALSSGRRLLRTIGGVVRRSGRNLREVVVAGEGPAARTAAHDLLTRSDLGYRIVEIIDASGAGDTVAARAQAAFVQLEALLDRQPIDEVFLAFPLERSQPVIARMVSLCEEQGVLVRLIADLSALPGAWAAADSLVGRAVMTIGTGPDDVTLLAAKRAIDITGALVGLLVMAPALALIAIAIKLDSPGPVIFAQERIGLNRRRFRALKFRTMVPDAERLQAGLESQNEADGPVFKIKADPRITRLGRWLRATSLDELPQLANVLRGEMSLVGPRPLPVRDVERIDVRWHKRRFSVKPGITCLWQIRSRTPEFDAWIRSDMEYIDNWSLALDLKILAKTLPAVLSRQNAY
jgi:exopolysaccharide biosynthesis polyprenyl glycosylphosphotransferase